MALESKEKQLYCIYQSKNVHILSSVLRNINYSTAASAEWFLEVEASRVHQFSKMGGKVFCSLKIRHSENCPAFLSSLGKAAK